MIVALEGYDVFIGGTRFGGAVCKSGVGAEDGKDK